MSGQELFSQLKNQCVDHATCRANEEPGGAKGRWLPLVISVLVLGRSTFLLQVMQHLGLVELCEAGSLQAGWSYTASVQFFKRSANPILLSFPCLAALCIRGIICPGRR